MRTLPTIQARASRDTCSTRARGRAATTTRRVAADLTPQAVEQIAQRVTQLLAARDPQERTELLTAGELARELRVERPWVYKHRHLLGGHRIGDGPKARWRFDPEAARRELARQRAARVGEGEL
jgi:hypothetical protein